jgi:hypothetical protein
VAEGSFFVFVFFLNASAHFIPDEFIHMHNRCGLGLNKQKKLFCERAIRQTIFFSMDQAVPEHQAEVKFFLH